MRFPLIIGVAGHCDISEENNLGMTELIRSFFDDVLTAFPNTPIILLSSLAEGGDRIVAKVAIEKDIQLIVPMPMPEAEYQLDFPDSASDFKSLLDSSSQAFVPPASHSNSYASAAKWVASHSHILLALWDEKDFDVPPVGGTAYSVKLRTDPSFHKSLESMYEYIGPVYHIKANRLSCRSDKLQLIGWLEPCREKNTLEHYFDDLETLNKRLGSRKDAKSQANLETERLFDAIDSEACNFQASHLRTTQFLLFLSTTGFMLIASSGINVTCRYSGLLLIILSIVGFFLHKKTNRYDFYLKLRACAEALRVRLFFSKLCIDDNISNIFGFNISNNYWAGVSLTSLDFLNGDRPCNISAYEDVKVDFINDQSKYFTSKIDKLHRFEKVLSTFVNILFGGAIALQIVVLFASDTSLNDLFITSSCVLLVVVAAMTFYSDLRGFKEDTNRYQNILTSFEYYSAAWDKVTSNEKMKMIHCAGLEIAAETKHWLLFHQTKKPDSFKG